MREIRCKVCNKLLGRFAGNGEVKCPRASCGKLNRFDTNIGMQEIVEPLVSTPMKARTTSSGVTFR